MTTQPTLPNEDPLIEALKSKKPIGAEWLYERYSNSLYGILVNIIKDRELAEDLLQQTFLKIWMSIDLYDSEKGRLFTWMAVIARNVGRDSLKSKCHRQRLVTGAVEDHLGYIEMHHTVTLNTDVIGLAARINCMEPTCKDVVSLVYLQGYTQKEAAEELNIPLGTIKTKCRKALFRMKADFN